MVIPVSTFPLVVVLFLFRCSRRAARRLLVFHEGQLFQPLTRLAMDIHRSRARGIALFGMSLGEALELPIRNATIVIKAMRLCSGSGRG